MEDFFASGFMFIVVIIAIVVSGIGIYYMSKKAGLSNAWWSFVPVLNYLIVFDIIKKSRWNVLLLLIPFVGIIFSVIWIVELLKAFDRNPAMILAILLIPGFSFFYFIYLGISSEVKYVY
jgi:hypothetical protein